MQLKSNHRTRSTGRIVLLASGEESQIRLRRECARVLNGQTPLVSLGGLSEFAHALAQGVADLVVLEVAAINEGDLRRIEAALAEQPTAALILVVPAISSEVVLRAMRAGVREVVLTHAPEGELAAAIRRQLERHRGLLTESPRGHSLAFMPAKGGCGATFLATNLGYALAQRDQRVAVIDLNLQFGDVPLFVSDRKGAVDLAQVCRDVDRLDGPMLESSMLPAADKFWVLGAPASPERAVDVRPQALQRVLTIARSYFDVVLLDLGRVVDAVTLQALDEVDRVHVVLQMTLPTLHGASRLLAALDGLGYAGDKLQLVANRVDRVSEIGAAQVRKALGRDLAVQIPNSYRNVVAAVNRGQPILAACPRDPVARRLSDWAAVIKPRREQRSGWLQGLFGVNR